MQETVAKEAPASRNNAVAWIVLLAASLIGASTGILIADRASFVGLKESLAAEFAENLTSHFANTDSEVLKQAGLLPRPPQAAKSKERQEVRVTLPGLSSIGAIRYSNQRDSANVVIDLGTAVLVGTAQLRKPDRICLDLRDSRQPRGKMGQLKAQKAIKISGQLLAGVRVSQWQSGAMRVVLDLVRSCDYTCQLMPGPSSRLIVALQARPGSAPGSN